MSRQLREAEAVDMWERGDRAWLARSRVWMAFPQGA